MNGFVAEHGVGGQEGEGAAYPGEPIGEERCYAQGEGGGYATGEGGGYATGEGGGCATGEGGGYATREGGGYATGEGGGYTTGEGGGYATGARGGYAQGEGGGYATGEGEGYATGAGGEYATVQGEGYEQGEGGGNETGVGGGYATGAGGEYETREGDGYEGEERGEDGGEEGGEDEGEEWGEEEGEEWGEDGTGEQGAYASGEGGVHATVQGGGYVTDEGGGYGTVRGGEDEGDEWGEGGTGEQGAYVAGEGGVHATVQGGGYEGEEGGENGTGEGGGYAAGEGGRYVVRGGEVYEEQEGGEFAAQSEGGYEEEEGGRVMAEGGEDGRARDPAEGDGALNAAVRQEAHEGGEDDAEDDDVERMLYPVRPVAEASRGSTMDESAEEAAAIMRGKAKCMATLNMDQGVRNDVPCNHGAEGGEKGEVGEQGGAEGEEGEAEDRMMERGKGVEGEAAAEQGRAEGEEGDAEDRMNKREKGVEGGASGVEGAAEIVERVNLAAGLEVEEGAKEWDEEEEGVPQPALCHLSTLASLPLTGDARRRREGEAGVCMVLSAPFLLARSLPSFRPCLPAIDRRCTEEEGGRGGGVHGPLCSFPIGLFSAPIPAILTQPALCHLSTLASLPLTGDARRRREGEAGVCMVLSAPFLLGYFQPRCSHPARSLPSFHPCLPAIDRRCTEEDGGRGGGVHGPLCSFPIGLFSAPIPAVLTQPALCHLSTLASLPLTGDAQRRREGEAGVCMVLSAPFLLGYFQPRCSHPARSLPSFHPCLPAIDRRCTEEEGGRGGGVHGPLCSFPIGPAVLTQPALCHLSTLASLPLTGDARRRREGEAGVCMVLSAPFLLGYFQPRCSHPARSLPSFRPCLPAIDRRCTEEEGGRGGGVHGPLCSFPIGLFSAPIPAVLTQPALCHLSTLASLPLTGDARRRREGEAGVCMVLSAPFLLARSLPSFHPCLPAIDRRCTEEEGGRGGGVHGPLCSFPIGPAVLTQPALCHLSTLASLPLTGDARRRREGEAGVCMVLSAPFLLGYFQPHCSHPARSLPSFHPCLPAIDRRCTEEEGGRGGGVHGPLFSFPIGPTVLTQPALCHLSTLASLPLTGDARRRREGEAGVCMVLSAPFLLARSLPSFHPCLPAIDRRCTEEEGGRGGGVHGPLCSFPIGLFSAPLFSPSPLSAIFPPLPPCH
ncbi:unnamed protein product [Closterium sp. NIES-65]|nr:unnamed protein product [Closterium sp. NIES-65]